MNKTIRTEFSLEIDQIPVVKRWGRSIESWCAGCARETTLIAPEDVAILTGSALRSIFSWIEEGRIHFIEHSDGILLICFRSLIDTLFEGASNESVEAVRENPNGPPAAMSGDRFSARS